jgi:hypothetical protein
MGEKQNGPFQLSFHASLKVDFQGSRVTTAALQAMRISTTPNGSHKIRRSA